MPPNPRNLPDDPTGDQPEEDVEGHSMLHDPTIGRQLARSREQEIQRNLKRHELETEARRPFKRDGR
jgi:hypothetical protein